MYITRELLQVYQLWLAIAQEYDIHDEKNLEMLAQLVSSAQKDADSGSADQSLW